MLLSRKLARGLSESVSELCRIDSPKENARLIKNEKRPRIKTVHFRSPNYKKKHYKFYYACNSYIASSFLQQEAAMQSCGIFSQ